MKRSRPIAPFSSRSSRTQRPVRMNTPALPEGDGQLLEHLEARALFSLDPSTFPALGTDVNPQHSVVRLQTSFGDIDLELYDQEAPISVANFLRYVRAGAYDQSFFHRLSAGFILQGGFTRLKTLPGTTGPFNGSTDATKAWESIPTYPAITNEFSNTRSNVARTVAYAKLGGDPNSATSQFFFNLANNASSLDGQNGGFTVFARIATDASWNVVQSIVSGVTINTSQGSPFDGTGNGASDDGLPVKTGSGFNGTDVNASQLVYIRDAEIIKPAGVNAYYTYRYYYPEGFAGSTINEFLPIGNTGNAAANYQIITRSEVRANRPTTNTDFWYRDKVVSSGSINALSRGGVTMSTFNNVAGNLVFSQGTPYAIEVWSTAPLAPMFSHYDFGSATLEAFTTDNATKWTFPEVRKGANINDFVLWQNTTDQTATITATFFRASGQSPITFTYTTEAFRRGGLNISSISDLPDDTYSLQLTSDRALVAAATSYVTGTNRGGATTIGIQGDGAPRALLPYARQDDATGATAANGIVSVLNPNSTAAFVTLSATKDDGTVLSITPAALLIPAQSRSSFDLSQYAALNGISFTLRYTSGSASVFASIRQRERGDNASNPFEYRAATRHSYGEGFMVTNRAGNDLFETLALFNPQSGSFGVTPQTVNVVVRFLFTNGNVVTREIAIDPDNRVELRLHQDTAFLASAMANGYYYSVDVVSDLPIVAMFNHFDTTLGGLQASGGDSTLGTLGGQVVSLSNLGGV